MTKESIFQKLVKNAGTIFLGNSAASALNIVSFSLMARSVGAEFLAVFALSQTYAALMNDTFYVQTWESLVKFGSAKLDDAELGSLIKTNVLIDSLSAFAAFLFALLLVLPVSVFAGWDRANVPMLSMYSLSIMFNLTTLTIGVPRLLREFSGIAKIQIAVALARLLAVSACYLLQGGPSYFIGVYLCMDILTNICLMTFGLRLVKKRLGRGWWRQKLIMNREQLHFIWWTNLRSIIRVPVRHFDVIVISSVISMEMLGYYKVYKEITKVVSNVADPVSQAIFPEFTKLVGNDQHTESIALARKSMFVMSLVAIALSAVLCLSAQLVVGTFFGKQYLSQINILYFMIIVAGFSFSTSPINSLFIAAGFAKASFYIVLFTNAVYLLMSYWCGSLWGLFGVVSANALQFVLNKELKVHVLRRAGRWVARGGANCGTILEPGERAMPLNKGILKSLLHLVARIVAHLPGKAADLRLFYALQLSGAPAAPAQGFAGTIREGTAHDLDALTRCTDKRARFQSRFNLGDRCLLAFDQGEVVGYLWFCGRDTYTEEQSGYTFTVQRDSVYSYDAYVREEYRQQGILSQLRVVLYRWMTQHGREKIAILISYDNDIAWMANLKKGFVPYQKTLCLRLFGKRLFLERPLRRGGGHAKLTVQGAKTVAKECASLLAVRSGLTSARRAGNRITLLMYHKVNPERDVLGLSISPEFFEQQLQYLKSRFQVITLKEAASLLAAGELSGEYAVLTFDDGYRDNYDHAFPLLQKYQLPATIFVTVSAVETGHFGWHSFDQAILNSREETLDLTGFDLGAFDIRTRSAREETIRQLHRALKQCDHEKREAVTGKVIAAYSAHAGCERIMLDWNETRTMHDSGLVAIGSHTMTHPILTRVAGDRARWEIAHSKTAIEERLGSQVDLFAYPNGTPQDFDDGIVDILKGAGYSVACTTTPGSAVGGADPFRLPRVDVTHGMCEGRGGRFSKAMFEAALTIKFR